MLFPLKENLESDASPHSTGEATACPRRALVAFLFSVANIAAPNSMLRPSSPARLVLDDLFIQNSALSPAALRVGGLAGWSGWMNRGGGRFLQVSPLPDALVAADAALSLFP